MSQYKNTILITGGTAGVGYNATLDIAKDHPDYLIVIASRSDNDSASSKINASTGQKNVVYLPLDLSSLANVRTFAADYSSKGFPPIAALLLNAGLQFPGPVDFSADGLEKTFAINHVGHVLLFYLLRPHLAPDARIVITSSGVHYDDPSTQMPRPTYTNAEGAAHPDPKTAPADGRGRYVNSKLVNVMWAHALHRHLQDHAHPTRKWTVVSWDPGLMPGTGLARDYPWFFRFIWNHIFPRILPVVRWLVYSNTRTPQESGRVLADLAVGDEFKGVSGVYFEGRKEVKSSEESYSKDKQDDLYHWTLEAVAKDEGEKAQFGSVYGS